MGSDENAYGCARSFYDVYGVKPILLCAKALAFTSDSKILTRKVINGFDTEEIFNESIVKTLNDIKKEGKRALVIPCSDYYAELTSKAADVLSPYVENPITPYNVYETVCEKEAFYNVCSRHGLPYPETLVSSPASLCGGESPFGYPVMIKPQNSNSYDYLHSDIKNRKKVYLCKSRAEYEKVLEAFASSSYTEKVIIQRYIDGKDSDMLTANAYCGKDGRVRAVGAAKPILCYRDPLSLGNYAALRTVEEREVCDSACALLEAIGYKGIANFDLKRDPETGIYLFLELNPRAGRSSYFMKVAGCDLTVETVKDCIEGLPFSERIYAKSDAVWSDVPLSVLKRYADEPLPKGTRPESAVSLRYDFSPRRFARLIYAAFKKAELFEEYK